MPSRGKTRIVFMSPTSLKRSFRNREISCFLLWRIRRSIAGVFLSCSGWFPLWFLLAYPAHRILRPSPSFLNLPGRAGGGGQLDPFVSRPVPSADPVFGFRVPYSFFLTLDLRPKTGVWNHFCLGVYDNGFRIILLF